MRHAVRWLAAIAAVGAVGCSGKGGGEGDDDDDDEPPLALSTVAGEARDLDVELVENTCDDDVFDLLDDLDLKVSQSATGLSVFVYDDLGWVPCEGSLLSFDCEWGDAPGNSEGSWRWRFWGSGRGERIDARLSLTITCDGEDRGCDDCEIVADVTAALERDAAE